MIGKAIEHQPSSTQSSKHLFSPIASVCKGENRKKIVYALVSGVRRFTISIYRFLIVFFIHVYEFTVFLLYLYAEAINSIPWQTLNEEDLRAAQSWRCINHHNITSRKGPLPSYQIKDLLQWISCFFQ